jgi:nucleotide-binding universal stress UspA family protein
MKKVLLAVDDTEGSQSVLSVFNTMVREPEGVVLVHVQRMQGKSMMIDMLGEAEIKTLKESMQGTEHQEELDRKAEKIVGFFKSAIEASGVPVKTVIREGIPADEILRVANEEQVDLIVMGCNGKRGLQKLVTGCVTKDVEKSAVVPVLVAKTNGCEKKQNFGWREAYAR